LLAFQQAAKTPVKNVRDTTREQQILKFIDDKQSSPFFLVQDNALGAFKNWYDKNRQATTGQIEAKYNELSRSMGTSGSKLGDVVKKIKQTSSTSERYTPKTETSMQAYDTAQRVKMAPEAAMSNAGRIRQAIADNQLNIAAQRGQTPFTDQVNALMKFMGQA
jgi:hypothetical protein